MASRWPVGGIRSFLRYVFSQKNFQDCDIQLVAPFEKVGEYLSGYIPVDRFQVRTVADNHGAIRKGVTAELRSGKYDLLHSHGLMTGVFLEASRPFRRIPHLMTMHDMFVDSAFRGTGGRMRKAGLNVALCRITGVHAVSEDCGENFRSNVPLVGRNRVHVVRSGIDAGVFSNAQALDPGEHIDVPAEAALIGYFGRFMGPKGFRVLVDAAALMREHHQFTDFRVVTFGWGGFIREDYEYLRSKDLGKFFIQHPQTDVPQRWMKAMDVVAMPSRWEACGLLAMEALCAGVPIVGTSCPGLREVLSGTPARMVPVDNPGALAEALIQEIQNPRGVEFEAYQQEAVKRFDVSVTAAQLRALYQGLVPASKQ